MLVLSSSLALAFAPGAARATDTQHPQAAAVQPQVSPQQSERIHKQGRKQAGDIRLGQNWRVKQKDRNEHLTVGRDWRVRH
jgi:hypothetical protein